MVAPKMHIRLVQDKELVCVYIIYRLRPKHSDDTTTTTTSASLKLKSSRLPVYASLAPHIAANNEHVHP